MADKRLDIFKTLEAIDRKNKSYYKNLTEEEQKGFAPPVVMRWLSTVSDGSGLSEYYTLMTNEIVNIGFWDLSKHPELQYLLMTLVGSGKKMNHQWIPNAKKIKHNKVDELFRLKHPEINERELNILWNIYTDADIKQLAIDYGFDDKQVKEYVSEFKSMK